MKKALFTIPLVCLTTLAGCVSRTDDIPNRSKQFDIVFEVYEAFSEDGGGLNDDFGGWNYGSDGYLHVMVTRSASEYEFLNEGEKRVVFEDAEYSLNYLEELAAGLSLDAGGVRLEGGSVSVHKNCVIVYVGEEIYDDGESMARLREEAGELPVEFAVMPVLCADA